MKKRILHGLIVSAALVAAKAGFANSTNGDSALSRIEREARHELVTLPFYSLFDHLAFRVAGETVTLMGHVTQPSLKSSAEQVVGQIEGVEKVVNEIEVLPLSSTDDNLRVALYRSIYGHSVLQPLALRSLPPIHIIVKNGHLTLEGFVGNEMQRNIAGVQATGVSGVFSVTNNLRVDGPSEAKQR